MRIVSNRRYKELLQTEEEYHFLMGKKITFHTGCRTTIGGLLTLNRHELAFKIIKLNNYVKQIEKKDNIKSNNKTRNNV